MFVVYLMTPSFTQEYVERNDCRIVNNELVSSCHGLI
jgi:hypothetical protein